MRIFILFSHYSSEGVKHLNERANISNRISRYCENYDNNVSKCRGVITRYENININEHESININMSYMII